MARNKTFRREREPLRDTDAVQLNNDKIDGPFSFLNPTRAHFEAVKPHKAAIDSQTNDEVESSQRDNADRDVPASNIGFKWTSRNNRKGRHQLVFQRADGTDAQYRVPPPTNSMKGVLKGIGRMFTYFPVWYVLPHLCFQ